MCRTRIVSEVRIVPIPDGSSPLSYSSEVHDRAIEVFGSEERAEYWLEKMSAELGSTPKDLLSTKEGYERVLRHLHSVDIALNRS